MAGKPELPVTPQSQAGVQNVVVYVSNDNIAQAYAVGQQNVASFTSQGSNVPASQHQNGTVVYANATHGVPQSPTKTFINKTQANGVLENGSIAHNNFYSFPQPNITYHNPQMLNNSGYDGVKNVIGFSASNSETIMPGRPEHKMREESNASETYITTDSGYVVMGGEVQGQSGSVMFPRCDSVRSETAESSCSSLSSGDSQADGVVMQAQTSQSGEIVMYESGVSVNVRQGQPLGSVLLTMVPPGPHASHGQHSQLIGSPAPLVTQVTIPYGWKRIITNGIVIYIR